jgi:hypothetical protein
MNTKMGEDTNIKDNNSDFLGMQNNMDKLENNIGTFLPSICNIKK